MSNNKLIELGRNWPEQIIVDHAPYWRAWRNHVRRTNDRTEIFNNTVGMDWFRFANGKNVGPELILKWTYHVNNELGRIPNDANPVRRVKHFCLIKSYLKWLYAMGAIIMDPSHCVPTIGIRPKAPKLIYTHDEYLRMSQFAMDHGWITHRWLLLIGYHTGMSLIDCCTLTWAEVDLPDDSACFIRRVRRKMRRFGMTAAATIPVIAGGELWVELKRMKRVNDEEKAFEREHGLIYVHPVCAEWQDSYHLRPTMEMNNFIRTALGNDRKGRTFRHLRNTFCSRLINSGADSVLVSKITGHATITQLAEYVVPDQNALQNAIMRAMRHAENESQSIGNSNELALPATANEVTL